MTNTNQLPITNDEMLNNIHRMLIDNIDKSKIEFIECKLPNNLNTGEFYNDIMVFKTFDISTKIADREQKLNKEDFINELIQPISGVLAYQINQQDKQMIICDAPYDKFISFYKDNVGIRYKFEDNILSFQIVLGIKTNK